MDEIIVAIILFSLSVGAFIMSIRSFMGKGFLLNNAYIYAMKEDREKINKKPYYRQSAITFLMIGLIFALNGFNLIFKIYGMLWVTIAVMIVAIVYAIASSIVIENNNKKQ